MRRRLREILDRLPGWSVERVLGSGHIRLRHEVTGALLIVSGTPGEGRATQNAIAQARRLERAGQDQGRRA